LESGVSRLRVHPEGLRAVSQVLDGRVGDRRKGCPRYPYNAGSEEDVGKTGYPASAIGVWFLVLGKFGKTILNTR
jgi:hypothetical protein